jgi:tetratricopeptide (TPR) repeat protein
VVGQEARVRTRRHVASALLGALAVLGVFPAAPAVAEPPSPSAPWVREVEEESAELDRQLADAKQRGATKGVVAKYASRVSRNPSALHYFLYARTLYHAGGPEGRGDPVAAAAHMRKALEADPAFFPAHVKLAMLQIDLKAYPQAEANLAEALRLAPWNVEATKLLVRVAEDTKDWPKARRHLETLLAKDPGDIQVRKNLAWVYLQLKAWDEAVRELRVLKTRDPRDVEVRMALAEALRDKGALPEAVAELDAVLVDHPNDVRALDRLRQVLSRQKDWARVKTTLERMLPLLPEDKRKVVADLIEELRKGPPPDVPTEAAPKRLTWEDVFAETASPVVGRRRQALAAVYEGAVGGLLREIPGALRQRISSHVEPDATCRSLALRIVSTLNEQHLPLLSTALYDEDQGVRLLAIETFEDLRPPVGLAYLAPLFADPNLDLAELSAVRAALTAITGFRDLAAGESIRTADEAAAVREAWRRWRLSDTSAPAKLAAIRQLMALSSEAYLERYLVDFVQDGSFEVMREAYLVLRGAVSRPGNDTIQKKLFPNFPRVEDAEVTRANMRTLQQRVSAWWSEWVAERRALLKARGAEGSGPEKTPGK